MKREEVYKIYFTGGIMNRMLLVVNDPTSECTIDALGVQAQQIIKVKSCGTNQSKLNLYILY